MDQLMVIHETCLNQGFSSCGSRPTSRSRNPSTWVARMLFQKHFYGHGQC